MERRFIKDYRSHDNKMGLVVRRTTKECHEQGSADIGRQKEYYPYPKNELDAGLIGFKERGAKPGHALGSGEEVKIVDSCTEVETGEPGIASL